MTVCADCGGPVDPDVIHTAHERGCPGDGCACGEVCHRCCTDPLCASHQPQSPPVPRDTPESEMWACVYEPNYRGLTNAVVIPGEVIP